MAEKVQEEFLVPKNLTEAKELVNKLSIEDLRTFCSTFALGQDGSKSSLKERLLEYYRGQFTPVNGTPVPTPRKKSAVKSPPSNAKESLASETIHGMDQKSDQPFLSIIDQLRKSDQRIDEIEFAVNKMGAYVEESLMNFRESLTEAIKDSTEKMMRSFDKPSQPSDDTGAEQVPLFCGSKFIVAKRRLKFLEKNAESVSNELEKLIYAEAAPSRIERQLKKLNDFESDCVHSLEEALANVEEEKLTDELLKEWDEFHSQILRISGIAEDFIAKNGVNNSSSEITEHITGVKLPLLQLPKFSGNVLEWPAFHDAFVASVDSHKKLSNVQKFTHLRSCLSGRALKCIEGYSVTNDNYSKAFQDLQNRFGRKRLLANELVKSILNLDIPEKADGKLLRELYDTLRNRMRSLESLGLKPDDNPSLSMVLLPIFETKLPRELKEKWELELTKYETEEEDKEINIKKFFQFLEGHVLSKEAPDDMKDGLPKHSRRNGRGKRFKNPDDEEKMSDQSLVGASDYKKMKCGFCAKSHETSRCPTALIKMPDERWDMLMKRKGAPTCFNCLQPGSISHNSRTCKAPRCSVDGCGRKHHQLLHVPEKSKPNEEDIQSLSGLVSTNKQNLLPTASARLIYGDKECPVRVLLDSGSQETFLRTTIANDVKMKSHGSPATMTIKVLGGQEQRKKMSRVKFKLAPFNSSGDDHAVSINAWTINSVCAPLAAVEVDVKRCDHLRNLQLADKFPRDAASVDLLVGADQYYKLVQGDVRKGRPGTPIATKSRLGWLLSGPVAGSKKSEETTAMLTVTKIESSDDPLKRFWELDAIGIGSHQEHQRTPEEEDAINQFNSSCRFDGERYEVGLPWKKDHPPLVDNYGQAYQRLVSTERRLAKDSEKARMYCEAVRQYIEDGHARPIDEEDHKADKIRYLPHHGVFREDRATTKCRVVFDSSAKTYDGQSLNSCLLKGPKLQPDLGHVLIRFRCHRVGIMADIKKMFLQIKLKRQDQNSHRFLWRDLHTHREPEIYCMTRVTFGDTPSPFLSIATVQKHAKEHEKDHPMAAKEVSENMYVDDVLTGAPEDDSAVKLRNELCNLLSKGGFQLTKWASNSQKVMETTPLCDRAPTRVPTSEPEKMSDSLKALGTSWNIKDDILMFSNASSILTEKDPKTKRSLISLYSRVFDPMGLLTPFLMIPKLLFQELWTRGLDWDQPLDADIANSWETWKHELANVDQIKVPRWLLRSLSSVDKVELHGFGDASERAYGTAVYICAEDKDGNRISNLVMAKSRVAPVKRISLPRLELLAAYITAKLLDYVIQALRIAVDAVYGWSDSQITLAWIRRPSSKWKVFVANRVQDIHQRVAPSQWRFCPGSQNPADLVTRGIPASKLRNCKLWWKGPHWLQQPRSHWPVSEVLKAVPEECLIEARNESVDVNDTVCLATVQESIPTLASRYETWQRLVRVTAWILKWSRLRGEPKKGKLSAEELKEAEFTWLRNRQRAVFLPEIEELCNKGQVNQKSRIVKLDPQFDQTKRLLVVGGRLQFAQIPEEAKHQIIIPHDDPVIEKLIMHLHVKACHAGPETTLAFLRQRFWLTQGRREVKRVLRKCLTCKRWQTKPVQQKMAPLPAERVQIAPPFTNIGLDFTGPLYLKVKGSSEPTTSKAYVCIFICEDTRAVHLELLNSMTTEDFLQAFRRMANRRGMARVIHSDNQTTFHKAAKVFKASTQRMQLMKIDPNVVEDKLANQGVSWKFITERASHRGGHWERVCRQLKEPLRKVLGKAFLNYTEMMTVLTDIEAIINSRPLTYVGDDIRDGRIITPALLAVGRDLGNPPDAPPRKAEVSLSERFRYQQRLQSHFWSRWLREYLPSLTVRQKWTKEEIPLKQGDVVLISEDNIPRGKWKLGKVVDTFPGKDGRIRTVRVQTKKGMINRPVQKLHLLEEYNDKTLDGRCAPSHTAHVQEMEEPRKCRRGETPSQLPEVNDCSSLVGEDEEADKYLTRYGREVRRPKRL